MTKYIIQSIIELAAGGFIIWGLFNENKLIKFENKLFKKIREVIPKK